MTGSSPPAPRPPVAPAPAPLSSADVLRAWFPLAASWLLMGLELPAVSAIMARLPDPERSLAAYGGVVFPLALLIESPVIMLLAASTALSRDSSSYRVVRRFMLGLGFTFTAVHALVAFTPLYDVVAARWLHVPDQVIEPARLGLRLMLPWTLAIAYRRTQQGVLIRFGHSHEVSMGTAVRLISLATVLGFGLALGRWPGIAVGTCAVATGVVCEALYAGWRVRPIIAGPMREAVAAAPALGARAFMSFYLPLLMTPLFMFLAMPLASAGMSRMARPMDSLAAWPALNGIVFTFRSTGFAFNEVVVALLDRPGAFAVLRRFAFGLAGVTSALLLLGAVTPLSDVYFRHVSALAPPLAVLAAAGLLPAILMPAMSSLQSLFQGTIVHSRRTRGITESMVVFLITMALTMVAAARVAPAMPGLWIAMGSLVAGNATQLAWLWWRARGLAGR